MCYSGKCPHEDQQGNCMYPEEECCMEYIDFIDNCKPTRKLDTSKIIMPTLELL